MNHASHHCPFQVPLFLGAIFSTNPRDDGRRLILFASLMQLVQCIKSLASQMPQLLVKFLAVFIRPFSSEAQPPVRCVFFWLLHTFQAIACQACNDAGYAFGEFITLEWTSEILIFEDVSHHNRSPPDRGFSQEQAFYDIARVSLSISNTRYLCRILLSKSSPGLSPHRMAVVTFCR